VLLDFNETTVPPAGAKPESVADPIILKPAATVVGDNANPDNAVGPATTVSKAVFVTPPKLALIVTAVFDETTFDVMVKLAVFAAVATATEAGTVAAAVFELESVTETPFEPAPLFRVTVPVTAPPALTELALNPSVAGTGGTMVRF
jgi:hypothetical protein